MPEESLDTGKAVSRPTAPRLALRWALRSLAVVFLVILVLLSSLSAILSTHRGSQWLLFTITDFLNTEAQSFGYATAEGTFLRGMNLNGVLWRSGDNQIRIEQLHSRWNPMTLLEGEFNLESLRIAGFQADWSSDSETTVSAPPMILDELLDSFLPLPVAIRLSNARLDGATVNYNENSYTLNSLGFTASLQGRALTLQQLAFNAEPLGMRADLQIDLQTPYPFESDIRWRYNEILLEGTQPARGQLTAAGNLDRLQITHQLHGLAELETTGEIYLGLARLLNALDHQLQPRMDLQHVLSPQLIPGLDNYSVQALTLRTQGTPEDLALFAAARLEASITDDIRVDTDANLIAALRGTSLAISELVLQTETGRMAVQGEVSWNDGLAVELEYSLADSAPVNYVVDLSETISIRDLRSSGQLQLRQSITGNDPVLQITFVTDNLQATLNGYDVQGQGGFDYDGERWQVNSLALNTGGNSVSLTAQLLGDNSINVDASIDAPVLSVLYPDLQGRLNAIALISGTLSEPVIDLDLTANDIRLGDLHIPELTATGQNRGGMNEIELTSQNIVIPIGDSTEMINSVMLRLRGQPDAHNLLLLVDSSLASLRINADGSLNAGAWQGRLLNSEIDSQYGRWLQVQSSALQLSADLSTVSDLCWGMATTRLCLSARLDNNEQIDARLALTDYPLAVINLPASEVTFGRELGITFRDDNASTDVRLPVTLPEDLALTGMVSFEATANGTLSAPNDMAINISALSENGSFFMRSDALPKEYATVDGNLVITDPVISQFTWPDISVNAEQTLGIWQLNSRIRFQQEDPDSTGVAMRGSADTNIRMDENQILNGEIQIDFDDLGWVEALVPQLTQVSGELAGRLSIQGPLREPTIGGDIMLSDSGFQLPALGLSLSAIEATLSSDDTDRFVLTAYAESGDGSLNISSEIMQPFNDERRMTVQMAGSDFMLANLPELQLRVTPDLSFAASGQGINMTGQLLIPTVDAQITTLPETAVDVSTDTVFVGVPEGDTPAVRNAAQTDRRILGDIPLSGDVRVILGDDVRVAGFGLNAQLRGQLDINQRPGASPLTYGELEVVEGSFQTYGRTLNIEQGKLLFMGSYDNPAIDIRAVRQVENMRVGVQMNGTIRNIRSNLFSTPTLPDGDILAVMITGRPIAEIGTQQDGNALIGAVTSLGISQGQGITNQIQSQLGLDTFAIDSTGDVNDSSLMLGKYITPRIFIRYAVGLFETENSLAIDYTMTDRIKLQAISGQSQSIDITYTVEQ